MNNFKEWLSDYLRYFMLVGIIILVLVAAIFGINVYSKYSNKADLEAKVTEQDTTPPTETEKEETETKETETETQKVDETETETRKVEETESETKQIIETETAEETKTETEAATEPPTESAPETEPPAPVYLTLKDACYIRSAPGYGDNIIGEYWAGKTVRFIADVGGWYKVEVDGMIGYMGARFF